MLLEFSVANFRSIKERQTLSLVAGSSRTVRSRHSRATGNTKAPYVLRAAAIYGSNGAGKSSLVAAMKFFHDFVLNSATDRTPGSKIAVVPYKFSTSTAIQPTEMEMVFEISGTIYQLGFKVDEKVVHSEWLYITQKGRPIRTLIERDRSSNDRGQSSWVSPSVPGHKSIWQEATREDSLLFSTAVRLNAKPFQEAFSWIHDKLHIVPTNSRIDPSFTAGMIQGEDRDQVMRFLKDVGVDVVDIDSFESDALTPEAIDAIPEEIRAYVVKNLEGQKRKRLLCGHHAEDGSTVYLPFEEESDGTQALISFAGPWIDVANNGMTIIVDELHNSLHPFALRYLLENYFTSVAGPGGGQLIFTTHETFSMESEVLHRDQVWFVDRSREHGSQITPLSDYQVRSNEPYRLGYLRGRYGGVPVTGPRSVRLAADESIGLFEVPQGSASKTSNEH